MYVWGNEMPIVLVAIDVFFSDLDLPDSSDLDAGLTAASDSRAAPSELIPGTNSGAVCERFLGVGGRSARPDVYDPKSSASKHVANTYVNIC